MLLAGAENIREVIMFPMNQRAEDLMMGAPSEATGEQLRELGIRLSSQGLTAEVRCTPYAQRMHNACTGRVRGGERLIARTERVARRAGRSSGQV